METHCCSFNQGTCSQPWIPVRAWDNRGEAEEAQRSTDRVNIEQLCLKPRLRRPLNAWNRKSASCCPHLLLCDDDHRQLQNSAGYHCLLYIRLIVVNYMWRRECWTSQALFFFFWAFCLGGVMWFISCHSWTGWISPKTQISPLHIKLLARLFPCRSPAVFMVMLSLCSDIWRSSGRNKLTLVCRNPWKCCEIFPRSNSMPHPWVIC